MLGPVTTSESSSGASSRTSSGTRAGTTLFSAVLGFFLITMDASIVNVALPAIRDSLGTGTTGQQWIVDGYTLPFAGLLFGAGVLTDRIGAKRAYGVGVAGFGIASVACALAPAPWILIAARVAQGAFAAAVTPASMALVRHTYDDPVQRGRAVSLWAMGGGVAAVCGPLLGGLLVTVDWRLIFAVNVPVVAVVLVLLRAALPSPTRVVPFDGAGQVAVLLAVGGLVFAAVEVGDGLSAPVIVAALVAVLSALAFRWMQRHRAEPLVPSTMFRSPVVVTAVATGFTFMVGFFGTPFVFSLFLQHERGLDALHAGLFFLPMMASGAVLTPFVPRLVERTGPRLPVVGGQVFMAASLLGLALVPADVPVWVLSLVMVPVGLTAGFINPPVSAVMLEEVEARYAGTAGAVYNTSRQVGAALAVAAFGALLAVPAGMVAGMRTSMAVAAALVLVTAVAGQRFLPGRRRQAIPTS